MFGRAFGLMFGNYFGLPGFGAPATPSQVARFSFAGKLQRLKFTARRAA